ncbi:MAG: glutamine--fructose-6-phosphate transaminase (isomerizing), partial [Burkholderiales bacterium]
AHLARHYYREFGELLEAARRTVLDLKGAYAVAFLATDDTKRMVCARRGSPLLMGLGIEENFIASDTSALLPVTQRMVYLEEGDIADIGLTDYRIYDANGVRIERPVHVSEMSSDWVELGNYRHFMQKEIHEQPRAISDTLEGITNGTTLVPEVFGPDAAQRLQQIKAVTIIACGTSYHAGMVARYWIESLAGIPCNVEVASEYRYRDSVPNTEALVVTISQSGETADTLAALKYAKELGHRHALCICNVPESALVRQSGLRFLTHAGPEIGVASTKAFTTQLTALYLLAITLAKTRGRLDAAQESEAITALRHLPSAVQAVLGLEERVEAWSHIFATKNNALFLGRGMHFPIAMEGALKLKEISYIHAEAYPAGELKHGPLALVDKDMPVVAIAPNDALLEKLKSNLQEVRARGGNLYVFADAQTHIEDGEGVHIIRMPEHAGFLSPILHTVPLQLLAYHTALQRGTDVDKPRNLAKSVTVE